MAKPPRDYAANGWYHVYNRGARRVDIYLDDQDRRRFLELLAETVEPGLVECHAYCLMGNHYHLLMWACDRQISTAMNRLTSRYVQEFNARHGFDGPMFRSRFGSTTVEDDEQLVHTARYIHRNPLDLWRDVATYEWSSHSFYTGRVAAPDWLSIGQIMTRFGGDRSVYRAFVEDQADARPAA